MQSLTQQLEYAHEARSRAWLEWEVAVEKFNQAQLRADEIGKTLDGRAFKVQKKRIVKKNGKLGKRFVKTIVLNQDFPEAQRRIAALRATRLEIDEAQEKIKIALSLETSVRRQLTMMKRAMANA